MASGRRLLASVTAWIFVCLPVAVAFAQYAEQNVNMVSGQQWPGGDPFLRQQNEPSIAISTRNALHLLAGANDYRSVDIPFNAPARPDEEETGDAWLGVFRSTDGGNRWASVLLDGYPQQTTSTSPLHGFQAAADPVVRAGGNGMFYYAGIVLNRGDNPLSGAFVARLIDNNNLESGDPIAYLDTKLIAKGSPGQFVDKPWILVTPASTGTCTVSGQTFPAQNVYLAYTILVGGDVNIRTKIYIAKSADCGATWSAPVKISETYSINQGVALGVDPNNANNVYVIWRQFKDSNDADAIILSKSTNGGGTYSKGTVVRNITPFEQKTTTTSIRSNAYPALAVDDAGRVHIAWSERDANGDGRIVLITSTDGGSTWSQPRQVDASTDRGHQFMPALTFAAGKLTIAWYDLRLDHTVGAYTKSLTYPGFYDETRLPVGNLAFGSAFYDPNAVFWNYLADQSPTATKLVRRHTLDVRLAEFSPAAPLPSGSVRASRYKFGTAVWTTVSDAPVIHDLQINPPNLPMFRQGTVPFFGDYIDVQAYQNANARVRHVVWTDNRDVRAPLGQPPDWTKYTPVKSPSLGTTSIFDPAQKPPDCTTDALGNAQSAGSRNQNIYTTRVTDGLFAGSPGNAKPLGRIQRAFAVFVQNTRKTAAYYRLTIPVQPAGGRASFLQFSLLTQLDVSIPARSTATRTVFVTNAAYAKVDVNVREINGVGGSELADGLASAVAINPDPANPDIGTPDIGTPDIGTTEVFNPDIGTPDIGTPDIGTPDIGTPDIGTPDIGTPDIGTPDIGTPDIGTPDIGTPDIGTPDLSNPDIGTPDIGSSDIQNGSATDTIWTATNTGNTTGGFTVRLLKTADFPAGVKSQLILHKVYDTPVARGCDLSVEHNRQVVANISNPALSTLEQILDLDNSGITDPSLKNPTMWLAPKEAGKITIRLVDPFHKGLVLDAAQYVAPVVVAQAVNTADLGNPNPQPARSIVITTFALPDGHPGVLYRAQLTAMFGVGSFVWTVGPGLPPGLSLDGTTGVISGVPTTQGIFAFTVDVQDSAIPAHHALRDFTINIAGASTFVVSNTADSGPGSLRQAILDSNANAGFTDTIVFRIPGTPPHLIAPASPLPGLDDPVVIDATAFGACDGSAPAVEIDGRSAGIAHGLFVAAGGSTIRGLAITDFATLAGIFLAGGSQTVIQCSYIGLAPDGVTAKPNNDGIGIAGSFNNLIGGTTAATRNVISGNLRHGIFINGPASGTIGTGMQTTVQGNFIGTDATGTLARGNGQSGVEIVNSAQNMIGFPPLTNVISGNGGDGVRIDGATATGNGVGGNLIGTTVSGTNPLGNALSGVYLRYAGANQVAGNVIAGNNANGVAAGAVEICGDAAGTTCRGGAAGTGNAASNVVGSNLIGRDVNDTTALPNGAWGLSINGAANTSVTGNSISANTRGGIQIVGSSSGTVVRANIIGTQPGGALNLGNGGPGVSVVSSFSNTIGGNADNTAANDIMFNAGAGISLSAPVPCDGNWLRFNRIDSNAGLGIELGSGCNNGQSFPVIDSAITGGGSTTVTGTLQSTPNTEFVIDLFESPACDPSGFGEGRTWFGGAIQTSDANGSLAFSSTIGVTVSGVITATATPTLTNNTSQFSACFPVVQTVGANALSFSGTNLATVPATTSLNLQDLTIEAWVKFGDPSFFPPSPTIPLNRETLVSKGAGFGNYALSALSDRTVEFVVRTGTGNYSCCRQTPAPLSAGAWTHIAAAYSSATGSTAIYVNGNLAGSGTGGPVPTPNTDALTIGSLFEATDFFNGVMDEVRIWNVVRSATDIAQNYNKRVDPGTTGLVGYWRFDESSGQAIVDSTANRNDGVLGTLGVVDAFDPARVASTAPILP